MSKKDLADVCNYMKDLVIPHTPEDFTVAEPFRHGLSDAEIKAGIAAFREFLYVLFDKLAADKDKIDIGTRDHYDPYIPKDKASIRVCFPSIFDLTIILLSLGFHGELEIGPEKKLSVHGEDLLTVICPVTEKYNSLIKMSSGRKVEMFGLLSALGLRFNGADFCEEIDFTKINSFSVTHEESEFFVIGLKLIAEATVNNKDYIKLNNLFVPVFLRCDFYPLANATPKKHVINIREFVSPHPPEIKDWILDLDTFLTGNCCYVTSNYDGSMFTYTNRKAKNRKEMVCRILTDITGCFIMPGVNCLENPNSIINILPNEIIDNMKDEKLPAHGSCGRCSGVQGSPDPVKCARGGPFKFTHRGEEFSRCRCTEFKFALTDAHNRDLFKKWIEMELAMQAGPRIFNGFK